MEIRNHRYEHLLTFASGAVRALGGGLVVAPLMAHGQTSKDAIVHAMRSREDRLASMSAEVRQEGSLLMPSVSDTEQGPGAKLTLRSDAIHWHYRYKATPTQFQKKDLEFDRKSGNLGVIDFDGRYKLGFELTRDPAKQRYRIGSVDKGEKQGIAPLLFGYWTQADDTPLGKHATRWSEFIATSEISGMSWGHDPVFGRILKLTIRRLNRQSGTAWLAADHAFLPTKVDLTSGRPKHGTTFSVSGSALAMVGGLPIVSKGIYEDTVVANGFTVQRDHEELTLKSIRVNERDFKIDWSLPEGMTFYRSFNDEGQGRLIVVHGQLQEAPPSTSDRMSIAGWAAFGGIGAGALILVGFGVGTIKRRKHAL